MSLKKYIPESERAVAFPVTGDVLEVVIREDFDDEIAIDFPVVEHTEDSITFLTDEYAYDILDNQQYIGETCSLKCRDCGDMLGEPTTDCGYDSMDPKGDNWVMVDIDKDGDADIAIAKENVADNLVKAIEKQGEFHKEKMNEAKFPNIYNDDNVVVANDIETAIEVLSDSVSEQELEMIEDEARSGNMGALFDALDGYGYTIGIDENYLRHFMGKPGAYKKFSDVDKGMSEKEFNKKYPRSKGEYAKIKKDIADMNESKQINEDIKEYQAQADWYKRMGIPNDFYIRKVEELKQTLIEDVEEVEDMITRRIMNHPEFSDMVNQYGIEVITSAIRDTAEFYGDDMEEIGSSDISAMVNDVIRSLKRVVEAEYRGRKVKLNKPMQGDVKKFKVYVKDPKTGNIKKVNFGHGGTSAKGKTMKIRKNNPKARKSFRARHNCDNPGPKTKARYWSCRKW